MGELSPEVTGTVAKSYRAREIVVMHLVPVAIESAIGDVLGAMAQRSCHALVRSRSAGIRSP